MTINKNKIEILKFLFTKKVDLSDCLTRAISGLIYETYFEKDKDVLETVESLLELKLIEIINEKQELYIKPISCIDDISKQQYFIQLTPKGGDFIAKEKKIEWDNYCSSKVTLNSDGSYHVKMKFDALMLNIVETHVKTLGIHYILEKLEIYNPLYSKELKSGYRVELDISYENYFTLLDSFLIKHEKQYFDRNPFQIYENNLLITLFEMRVPYRFLLVKNMSEEFNISFPLAIEERFLLINNLIDNGYVHYVDNKYNEVKREELEDLNYDVFIELTQKGGAITEKLLNIDWTTYHDCGWGCDMSLNTANITKLNHIKEIASSRLSSESCLEIIEENPWNATYWKTIDTTGYQIELTLTDKEFRRYFNFYSYGENEYKLPPSDLNIPTFLDEKETESISKKLNLKSKNINMDWDLEFSDYHRIEEFIDFLNEEKLTDDEKFLLVALIFASFDDKILNTSQMNMQLFSKFVKILKVNYALVKPILDYWMPDKGSGSFGEYLIRNKPIKNNSRGRTSKNH